MSRFRLLPALVFAGLLGVLAACSPSSPDPARRDAECPETARRCLSTDRIQRCEAGRWAGADACPLLTTCLDDAGGTARCDAPPLETTPVDPLHEASLTLAEFQGLAPERNTALVALFETLHRHYAESENHTLPSQVDPARRFPLDDFQRTLFARHLMRRVVQVAVDALKDRPDFEALPLVPLRVTETPVLSYRFLHDREGESDAPGVRLEVLLGEEPNAGVRVKDRLVQVSQPDIGLYLTVGLRMLDPWGDPPPADVLRGQAEALGATLSHVFRRESFAGFADLCPKPPYSRWVTEDLGLGELPESWRVCAADCIPELPRLDALAPRLLRDPSRVDEVRSLTNPAAALCAGLIGYLGAPPGLPPLAPDHALSVEAATALWRGVLDPEGLADFLVALASTANPRYAVLLSALDALDVPVVRKRIEARVRQGPGTSSLALIPIWARIDEQYAAAFLIEHYPLFSRDPEARRIVLDAIGHNPTPSSVDFLLSRIEDTSITRKALFTLMSIEDYRPRGLQAVETHGNRFTAEQAIATLDLMMFMLPGTRGPRPAHLLPLVWKWEKGTDDFRVYRMARQVIGNYTMEDWNPPRRAPEVDFFLYGMEGPVQEQEDREAILAQLSGAGKDEVIWLVDYLQDLQGEPRERARRLLRELARRHPLWKEELTRLAAMNASPKVATLAVEALKPPL